MAAFSRGASIASACCTSSFRIGIGPSCFLPRHILIHPFITCRPFSESSSFYKSRTAQKIPKRAIQAKIKSLKQELEARKAQEIANRKLQAQGEVQGEASSVSEQDGDIPEGHSKAPEGQNAATRTAEVSSTRMADLKSSYRDQRTSSVLSPSTNSEFRAAVSRIMNRGEPVLLYQAPKGRGHFELACAVSFSIATFCIAGTTFAYWEAEITKPVVFSWTLSTLFFSLLAWQAIRKRARRVKRITMVPTRHGNLPVMEVHVQGTSWIPLLKSDVQVSLLECGMGSSIDAFKVDESRLQKSNSIMNHIVTFFSEFRVLANPSSSTYLARLWTEEGNPAPLKSWWIDARGDFPWYGRKGGFFCLRPFARNAIT